MLLRALLLTVSSTGFLLAQSASGLVKDFEQAKSFYRQIVIAQKIADLNDRSVLPTLEPWLSHDQRHLRGNAALIFGRLGDRRGFETIAAILNDFGPRGEAPEGMWPRGGSYGSQGPTQRKFVLEQQIQEDRYYAVHLLGMLQDPRAIPVLEPLLSDSDVNYKIPWALDQIGGDEAVRVLIKALDVDDPQVRVYGIQNLEKRGVEQALPRLRELLQDSRTSRLESHVSVAEAARKAIATLEQLR